MPKECWGGAGKNKQAGTKYARQASHGQAYRRQKEFKMKRLMLLGAVAGMGLAVLGHGAPARANVVLPIPAMQSALPESISVSGHAEIKAQPDVAYLNMGVTTTGKTPDEASRLNATQTTALITSLRKANVAASDIHTQGFFVQPQYDYRTQPAVLAGYQATNSLQVTVHVLANAGPLLDTATKAGATQVGDISFDLVNRQSVQRQALAAAVRDARARADTLAQAAEVGVGRLLSLSDSTAPVVVERPYPMMRSAMAKSDDQAATPISPQQIVITADVSALYAIGPR